ncbi:MAG: hypothetical protein AAB800_00570 [Patescibacteria group bacterium]
MLSLFRTVNVDKNSYFGHNNGSAVRYVRNIQRSGKISRTTHGVAVLQEKVRFFCSDWSNGGVVPVTVELGELGLVEVSIACGPDTGQTNLDCSAQIGERKIFDGTLPLYTTGVVKLFDPRKNVFGSAAESLFASIGAPVALDELETEAIFAEILLYRFTG